MNNFSRLALTLSLLLACIVPAHAQDSLKTSLKNTAAQFFSEKNYVEALPVYIELLRSFPKEPAYMFGTGVCYVNLNRDIEEAIRLLRAVSVTDYSPLSWYYLGRAYHLYYSFEDAIKAYSKFMLKGKSADIKLFHVERLIEMARNGIEYTHTGHPVIVQNLQTIQIDQLQLADQINGSGKLMRKPAEFCNKTDIRNNYKPWMFLPSYTEINEYVYVAGYEQGKKNQKQLFRIKNINHETWGFLEPLKEINSPYDEEYPYFDTRTSTLYFSSKGYSSMGGYDIFKSAYDWNSKTWSRPENLGFPINSPFDDFIYITDELNHSASFVSTRDVSPNQATIYKIRLQQDTTGIHFMSVDEIRQASKLLIENKTVAVQEITDQPELEPALDSAMAPAEITMLDRNNYNKLLSEALVLQIRADSSAKITRDLRILAKETPDNEEKKQLVSEIIKNDKEAKGLQREADLKFTEARKIKLSNDNDSHPDSVVTVSKVINGITIYQYNAENPEPAPQIKSRSESPVEPKAVVQNSTPPMDEFTILEKSPYNESNPISQCINTTSGLLYRIQLGVLSKPAANEAFGGISPVCLDHAAGSTIFKYYTGSFYSLTSVNDALEIIRAKGFPDAFIVAYFNGKLITTEKAREIEYSNLKL